MTEKQLKYILEHTNANKKLINNIDEGRNKYLSEIQLDNEEDVKKFMEMCNSTKWTEDEEQLITEWYNNDNLSDSEYISKVCELKKRKDNKVCFDEDKEEVLYESLIKEDQESKAMQAGINYLVSKGYDQNRAREIFNAIRNDIPSVRLPLYTNSNGREKGSYKFIIGVERMYLNRELSDGGVIQRLNQTLKLLASDAHVNEYNEDLNGMSANDLINRFSGAMANNLEKDKQEVGSVQYSNNKGYNVVRINSYEEAEKYGQYTSWCVTHYKNMYDSYTSNGLGLFYFFLKNGFEKMQAIQGEGCPLDEYGLSMIAVSINSDGAINTVTCRWNHDNGGNDNIMDARQLSEVVGMNVYEVCKPMSDEELFKDGYLTPNYANEMLKDGKTLKELYITVDVDLDDDHSIVYYTQQKNNDTVFNVYSSKTNRLLSRKWCYDVIDTENPSVVKIMFKKYGLIDLDREILVGNQYYDYIARYQGVNKDIFLVATNQGTSLLSVSKNKLIVNGDYNYINKTNVDKYYLVQDDESYKYNLFDCMNERFVFNEWCVNDENKHLRINGTHVYHFYNNSNDVYFSFANQDGKVDFITKEEYETLCNKAVSNNRFSYNENKIIYLTESQYKYIKENLSPVDTNKVLVVKKYLDDNFVRGNIPTIDNSGYPKSLLIVGMKGTDGKVAKNMTAEQLLELLIDRFQKIYTDKDKRRRFLRQVMKDWYNKKITKEGLLSVIRY